MTYTIKKFSAACAFALLLVGNSTFAEVEIFDVDYQKEESQDDVTRKSGCGKNKVYGNVTVCSNLSTDNIWVTGNAVIANLAIANETIENLVVNGTTTLNGLLSLTTPNVLDYAYFYTQSITTPNLAMYVPLVNSGSYAAQAGIGIRVLQAGVYGIFYSATFNPIAGSETVFGVLSNFAPVVETEFSFVSTGSAQTVSGSAILELDAFDPIGIYSNGAALYRNLGNNSASLAIVRLR